jgi:hypothetical protein
MARFMAKLEIAQLNAYDLERSRMAGSRIVADMERKINATHARPSC